MKKALRTAALGATLLASCGAAHAEANQVRFARQLGLGYLQFYVMQDKQMVERQAERVGQKVTAVYSGMGTPTAISDALLSGNVDVVGIGRSVNVQTLLLWACAPLFCVAYVRAAQLVLDARPRAAAYAAALVVFLPFPLFVRLYVLPGVAWFGVFGLAVPAAMCEGLRVPDALRRGWQLGRADLGHAIGGIATLALVYGVSKAALLVLLHTQGDQTERVAVVLADLVLSPLLFVGGAMLYADQAARVE